MVADDGSVVATTIALGVTRGLGEGLVSVTVAFPGLSSKSASDVAGMSMVGVATDSGIPPQAIKANVIGRNPTSMGLSFIFWRGRRKHPVVIQLGFGSAGRIRTYDQSVNSRPLYH